MKKFCAHCGRPFESQRNSRLYCSDNCKQLAYYKRNGLILSGCKPGYVPFTDDTNIVKDITNVKDVKHINAVKAIKDVKYNNSIPDTFVDRLNAFIEEEIIRRISQRSAYTAQPDAKDVDTVKPYFTLSDNNNTAAADITDEINQQDGIYVKDDNADKLMVKSSAIAKPPFTLNAKPDSISNANTESDDNATVDSVTERDHKLTNNAADVKCSPFAKPSFTLNGNLDSTSDFEAEQSSNGDEAKPDDLIVKDEIAAPSFTLNDKSSKIRKTPLAVEDNSEAERTSDIDVLEFEAENLRNELLSDVNDPPGGKIQTMNAEDKSSGLKENINPVKTDQFKRFGSTFTERIIDAVHYSSVEISEYSNMFGDKSCKVLVIFKCLLKQLLRFSNRDISYASLVRLSNTFFMLVNSNEFLHLPKSFLYLSKIKTLQEKIRSFAQSTSQDQSVRLHIPAEQRAAFFAMLCEMEDSVKDVKFDEIGFKHT